MIKGIFICCFLFTYNAMFAQSEIDVLHYKFEINLSDQSDTLNGKAEISFIVAQWNQSVSFDLSNLNSSGKGMRVTQAGFKLPAAQTSFQQQDNKIILTPSLPFKQGDTLDVFISYKGIPSDGLIISRNKYGDRTFFGDNWPNRAHNWIPCKDEPGDKASFEFLVTAPSHYSVISNGKKIEERMLPDKNKLTYWAEDIPLPTKVMVIGVAKFAVKEYPDSPDRIPVSAWVYPQDSVTGFRNYSVAPSILKFMADYIAPYPYNKLANVESTTIFGGMENAGAIFYFEGSASLPTSQESLVAHEIAHQWFGDMASEKKFAHLWLSEGFATYMTHIYIESKYGTDSLNKQMQADRRQIISFANRNNRPIVDSLSAYLDLLNANSYQKGGWVLHMLRRELGDVVFQKIIRSYYEKYKGKNADTRDFESVAEKISGKNLETFFDQWLYNPGLPELKISWKYIPDDKKIMITVDQVQQEEPFRIPLEIRTEFSNGKSEILHLMLHKRTETFFFNLQEKPSILIADPNVSLLYKGSLAEIK